MYTWRIDSFKESELPEWVIENYLKLKPYVAEFLTSKHPHRNGVMCPFMPKALSEGHVYFSYFEGSSRKNSKKFIKDHLSFFEENIGRKHGAIIIIFKEDFDISELLRIHIKNKEQCINKFIMLGALFENSSAPSLHNDAYFPLRTPIPTLVMRDLTSSDLVFLEPGHYSSRIKYNFLSAFIKRFSEGQKNSAFTAAQIKKAEEIRERYLSTFSNIPILAMVLTTLFIILFFMKG